MKIYLASRYQDHPLMRVWRDELHDAGHEVTSRWIEGEHESKDETQEGDSLRQRFAEEDIEDLLAADAIVLNSEPEFFRTGRGGKHVEFGIALAAGKKLFLVGERENVFHWCKEVMAVPDLETLLKHLSN